jgi:hypothetical protein
MKIGIATVPLLAIKPFVYRWTGFGCTTSEEKYKQEITNGSIQDYNPNYEDMEMTPGQKRTHEVASAGNQEQGNVKEHTVWISILSLCFT